LVWRCQDVFCPHPLPGGMAMAIMAILIGTAMETMVTGIVVVMIQGMDPVTGDEIKGKGDNL
jgi:hypothetical protein